MTAVARRRHGQRLRPPVIGLDHGIDGEPDAMGEQRLPAVAVAFLGERPMGNIDRQRIAAVKTLEALGYTSDSNRWMPPAGRAEWPEVDALYFAMLKLADDFVGCVADSAEERVQTSFPEA
jgi:hypothetical protein